MTNKITFEVFDKERFENNKQQLALYWLNIMCPNNFGRLNNYGTLLKEFGVNYKWNYSIDGDILPIEYWNKLTTTQQEQLNQYNIQWTIEGMEFFFNPNKPDMQDEFYKNEVNQFYIIMLVDKIPVAESGFVILKDKSAIIHGLEVAKHHRKKGYATQIISKGIEVLQSKGVNKLKSRVSQTNIGSQRLHEKNNFKTYSSEEHYIFYGKEI